MAKILLVDDHPAVRHGLGWVLSGRSHTICGEAGSVAEVVACAEGAAADIALVDLALGEESGIGLIAVLRERGIPVLVYSMHGDAQTIGDALSAGADGYVSKRESAEVLLTGVDAVLAGARFVSPLAAQAMAREVGQGAVPEAAAPRGGDNALSERESRIVAMLGRGGTNGEIATALAISVRTLETYFERISNKLDVGGTRELRRYAISCASNRR